ncbi:DUF4352 domain-containing protein [Nocardiopsis sp. CA-288880]|uniref:DUF4352 domain-containing protein n=1 Tax=Nocardiopsis sp. CA-288880 TaxID=3239995 RepID=UPI003D98D844
MRALAVPVAVFLAAAGCVGTVVSLNSVPSPDVRVTVGEEEPGPGAGPSPGRAPEEGDPGTAEPPGPGTAAPEEPETAEPETAEPETAEPETGGGTGSVPPGSYDGVSVAVGEFAVTVETAYTDATITDGMGMHDTAPEGWEYFILRLDVTNAGSAPAAFDPVGSLGTATDGSEYTNDSGAEYTVAHDYFWDDLAPGETVTTHILFLVPAGTELSSVLINGEVRLSPN